MFPIVLYLVKFGYELILGFSIKSNSLVHLPFLF